MMGNPQGCPIWYELVTPDPDAAKIFYDAVVGWTIEARPSGPIDYRMIAAGDGVAGGVMRLDAAMAAGGARPGWLMYIGVDDVDAIAGQAGMMGAATIVPPTDIPGVGRFALLADPQGAPFYVMRGASAEPSAAFARGRPGHVGWNELSTTDGPGALAFYGALVGWQNRETLPIGHAGGYHFLDLGEMRLGALVEARDTPAAWRPYITVAAIEPAIEAVRANGGRIDRGPQAVPGGETILIGTDPQGAAFALVASAGIAA